MLNKFEWYKREECRVPQIGNGAISDRISENEKRKAERGAVTVEAVNAVKEMEEAFIRGSNDLGEKINAVAQMVSLAVLKKLVLVYTPIDPTTKKKKKQVTTDGAKRMNEYRLDIINSAKSLSGAIDLINENNILCYNKDGNIINVTLESDIEKDAIKLLANIDGDGVDLKQDAALAIMEEYNKALQRGAAGAGWFTATYSNTRINPKVRIKWEDTKGGYITEDTTALREVFRAVRRAIINSRAAQVSNNYIYIEDGADGCYYRLDKYSELAREIEGASINYVTASMDTVCSMEELIAALDLNANQEKVLRLRMRYDSYISSKAIARYLGRDPKNVARTIKQIQKKVDKKFPEYRQIWEQKQQKALESLL